MIFECKNVTKQFGKIVAIDDISFNVERGEILGITGPNGSGKTTMFNLITGFYPYTGEMIFDGESITRLQPHRINHKGIARTFQIPQLFQTLSIFENIMAGVHFGTPARHPNEKMIAQEMIEFVGLQEQTHRVSSNLKLLDKKKTMIATALATKPKMLLLDEPTAGLSPVEVWQSVEMFKKINQELGITILIIEHLMKVIVELSNRLMIIDNGQRIAMGKPVDIYKDERVIECYLGECHA